MESSIAYRKWEESLLADVLPVFFVESWQRTHAFSVRSLVTRGLAVSTPWSLGKEKHSRIDARIFPNPSGSSSFPIEYQRKTHAECVRSLVTLYGGFHYAQRKRKRFPNPSGSSSFPIEHQRKTHAECVRSLVTLCGGFRYAQRKRKRFPNRWVQVNPCGTPKSKKPKANCVRFRILLVTLNQPKSNLFQNRLTLKRHDSIYCRAV